MSLRKIRDSLSSAQLINVYNTDNYLNSSVKKAAESSSSNQFEDAYDSSYDSESPLHSNLSIQQYQIESKSINSSNKTQKNKYGDHFSDEDVERIMSAFCAAEVTSQTLLANVNAIQLESIKRYEDTKIMLCELNDIAIEEQDLLRKQLFDVMQVNNTAINEKLDRLENMILKLVEKNVATEEK